MAVERIGGGIAALEHEQCAWCGTLRVSSATINFNGKTFLQWSRDNAFPESDRWHPLESAHRAAADYWTRKFQSL